jgi:protein-tyrosine-phosphatase
MANKRLTREEMAQIMRKQGGISRGSMNRTLRQARTNTSEAIHTILLLGYGGLFDSPSLAPFVEASERLKSHTERLLDPGKEDNKEYRASVETLLQNLEDAFKALYGKVRDT